MYLKSVENVITLGKLIGLLFLFCLPLLSILFLKTKRNDLAHPVIGNIFLVGRAKRAPHWGVQSRFRVILYIIYNYIYLYHSYYGNSHVIKVIISLLNFLGI